MYGGKPAAALTKKQLQAQQQAQHGAPSCAAAVRDFALLSTLSRRVMAGEGFGEGLRRRSE